MKEEEEEEGAYSASTSSMIKLEQNSLVGQAGCFECSKNPPQPSVCTEAHFLKHSESVFWGGTFSRVVNCAMQ